MTKDKGITALGELAQLVSEESLSRPVPGQGLRDDIAHMIREASQYGFTEADVVRAVLRPLLDRKRHCDCWSCRARRGELEEEGMAAETSKANIS